MCINEGLRAAEIAKRDKAVEEVARCTKGIAYFNEYKSLATACRETMISMRERNGYIAQQCEQIIIDGKRIDNGKYYTEGHNATYFKSKFDGMIRSLYNLIQEMQRMITELEASRDKAKKARTAAIRRIQQLPVPCGVCYECCPQVSTTTTTTSPSQRPSNRRGGPQRMEV